MPSWLVLIPVLPVHISGSNVRIIKSTYFIVFVRNFFLGFDVATVSVDFCFLDDASDRGLLPLVFLLPKLALAHSSRKLSVLVVGRMVLWP